MMQERKGNTVNCWVVSGFMLLLMLWSSPVWAQSTERGLSAGELMRGIGLTTTVIAIVSLILIEFIYRKRLQRGTYHLLLLIGLFILPMIVIMSTTATVLEETKTISSCASCHVMEPFINDMTNANSATLAARHYKNKWIADHQCYSCHTTYGVHGTLAAKRDGFRHWLLYVTGTWEDPIQYSGSYPNSNCLACHTGTQKFERVKSHNALASDLATNRVGCFTCHGPPHPVPSERVSIGRTR
ncbi:MAG: NapC/NirT family cytochrome c [Acidiferrobacterales bacterium]